MTDIIGPRTITRAGETFTEWEFVSAVGYTYRLKHRRGIFYLRDEDYDISLDLDPEDLAPMARMLTAAAEHVEDEDD